jgi:hypothetical protein
MFPTILTGDHAVAGLSCGLGYLTVLVGPNIQLAKLDTDITIPNRDIVLHTQSFGWGR